MNLCNNRENIINKDEEIKTLEKTYMKQELRNRYDLYTIYKKILFNENYLEKCNEIINDYIIGVKNIDDLFTQKQTFEE